MSQAVSHILDEFEQLSAAERRELRQAIIGRIPMTDDLTEADYAILADASFRTLDEEVRAARRKISAEHGHDIHRLFEHYRKREAELKRTGKARFIEAPAETPALREEPKPYKP